MKQHITIEQLDELSHTQKEKLREWWTPKRGGFYFMPNEGEYLLGNDSEELNKKSAMRTGALPLLSIGRMIEYLQTKSRSVLEGEDGQYLDIRVYRDRSIVDFLGKSHTNWADSKEELCDVLWEAMKHSI